MRTISIQDLKENLSTIISEVAAGATVVITKHHKPIVVMESADEPHVHTGKNFGKGSLRPVLNKSLGNLALEYLEDDRRGGGDR